MANKMEFEEFKAKTTDAIADVKRALGKIDPDNPYEMSKLLASAQEKMDLLQAYQKVLNDLYNS